ncbi:AAA family ATPase [Aquamicrobium terrae]|uniref:Gluconate kinase n=1 Tax=Aquamicrobium terrae TaxID=1324945 RepID=A0ABV2N6H3_9HYPH
MPGGLIVHLNGWPGVGKLTVGRALADRLGARLIDNHLLHDVAIRCTGLADPGRWPLYEKVRHAAYEALKDRPHADTLVITNALCANDARERQAWNHVVDLAIARNAPLVPVVLEADFEENARRLRSPDRAGRKLADPAVLRSFLTADSIQKPDVPDLLVLDVTRLSADQAADAICRHLRSGADDRFRPATDRHRNLQP